MIRHLLAVILLLGVIGTPSAQAVTAADKTDAAPDTPRPGDFSQMQKNGVMRVLIPYSVTGYHLDRGHQRGIYYDYMMALERSINRSAKTKADRVEIVIVPTRHDELLDGVIAGRGDLAVAGLTITPERQSKVEFSSPVRTGVTEVVVTQDSVPDLQDVMELSGWRIHVRQSSSHFESLKAINERLKKAGKPLIDIVAIDEVIQDEDLLEMVHNGIVTAIVADDYKAQLWADEFSSTKLHREAPVRQDADIAWAFRKKSPELAAVVNGFIDKEKPAEKYGKIPRRRYFHDIDQLTNPKTDRFQAKFKQYRPLFETYGKKYDIDPMLLAAQAFQESKFNAHARSRVGAYGLMQLMPRTARSRAVGIRNYRTPEGSVEAGAKYMRFISDHYFDDESIDDLNQILLSFAAYNAGPSRVSRVRKRARDPNVWFDSVEWQVARAAGIQPIHYVRYIFIYHIVFSDMAKEEAATHAKGVSTDAVTKDAPSAAAKTDKPADTTNQDETTDAKKTDDAANK